MTSIRFERPKDFIYDLNYILSGEKDYNKLAAESKMLTAKYAVCPIYPTMFSDLKNYPRKQYIMRKQNVIPVYVDKIHEGVPGEHVAANILSGIDRFKYFHNPARDRPQKSEFPCVYAKDANIIEARNQKKILQTKSNKSCQTKYRETSAQTTPWQPDFKVLEGNPEILTLDFLKWGDGLPPGNQEVAVIERGRMKRNWEKAMPRGNNGQPFDEQTKLIELLETNRWADREREIEDIQNLRLEIQEKMLHDIHEASKCRNQMKLRLFYDLKDLEKTKQISEIHKQVKRERRRLELIHMGALCKYSPPNTFNDHSNCQSDLYVPMIRHGNNPKYGHQLISKHMQIYKPQYRGVEYFKTLPSWLKDGPVISKNIKLPGTRLCIHETKWTDKVLKQLHTELKCLGYIEKKNINLRVERDLPEVKPLTPTIAGSDDDIVEVTLIQKVMRGRAIQMKIFKGRETCRELIDELRKNVAFLQNNLVDITRQKEHTVQEQFNAGLYQTKVFTIENSLKHLGGHTVGLLLDFLNKEVSRLHLERQVHAMALLVERLRVNQEAGEAGRRQREVRRRLEHDEIFKQTVKINQETVDLYLENIVMEEMKFKTKEETSIYIEKLAKKYNNELTNLDEKDFIVREEYVANLIHHFVIPEVEKCMIRERSKLNNKLAVSLAHNEIYNLYENFKNQQIGRVQKSVVTHLHLNEDQNIEISSSTEVVNPVRSDTLIEVHDILEKLTEHPVKRKAMLRVQSCSKLSPQSSIIEPDPELIDRAQPAWLHLLTDNTRKSRRRI